MGGIPSEAPKRKREKKLLVNILQPLVRDKYMSASLAIKCASSGLGLHHLQVIYKRGEASSDGEVWQQTQSLLKQAGAGANMSILQR